MKQIRDLGVGPGGFYTPSYKDGGQLHLKMMCLGEEEGKFRGLSSRFYRDALSLSPQDGIGSLAFTRMSAQGRRTTVSRRLPCHPASCLSQRYLSLLRGR